MTFFYSKRRKMTLITLLQLGVPEMESASTALILRLRETPKSVSLTSPVFVVKILAAFKSQ